MRIYKRQQDSPGGTDVEAGKGNSVSDGLQIPQHSRIVEPCDFVFRYLFGEFLGTLLLTFFGAHFLSISSENLTVAVLCTGALRYAVMKLLGDVCDVELNPAISLGKLFILQRQIFVGMTIIGGQLFGAFIGQVLYQTAKPYTISFDRQNQTTESLNGVRIGFESTFALESVCTLLYVMVFLKSNDYLSMGAVTMIAMTVSQAAGYGAQPVGNAARTLAQSAVSAIWQQSEPWGHLDAVVAASFMTPFLAAAVYWILNSIREMTAAEDDSNR